MCNIAGYVGSENASSILIEMTRRQEGYAGGYYTGIATLCDGRIHSAKITGDLQRLLDKTNAAGLCGSIGLMHSRSKAGGGDEWAHPFLGMRDGEAACAYIANGSLGCFAPRLQDNIKLTEELFDEGYTMLSRTRCGDNPKYPTLSDGTAVHMSDAMCQLILRNMNGGIEAPTAMEKAFCEMPSEIVGLLLNVDEPNAISWSRINMPVFVSFARHGAYIASTPLAFPSDAGEPVLLPAMSSGRIYADHFTVYPYAEPTASVARIDARVYHDAYRTVYEYISDGERKLSDISKCVKKLFCEADCFPTAALVYSILYSFKEQGMLRKRNAIVEGAAKGIDAPLTYVSMN